MPPVSIVFTIILWVKAKTYKFVVYFLLCCKACFSYEWLHKHSTNFTITIFGKANHVIFTIRKIAVVSLDAFKEGN